MTAPLLRRHASRAALVARSLCVVVLAAGPAVAGQEQRALLDLVVNRVEKGQVVAVLRQEEVWIAVQSLEDAGLHGFAGERAPLEGVASVRLGSLKPGLAFEVDERNLALRLTAPTEWLGRRAIDLKTERPRDITYSHNTTAFLNYAVNVEGANGASAFADAGLSVGRALVATTLVRSANQPIVRGQTAMTIDDRGKLRRWTIGDAFANTGLLGGGAFLGGIGVSRDYGLDPYFLRFPTMDMAGAVSTPSTLEVYINDRLVRREDLPPGRFDVASLPVTAGSGTARLVLRDAFGDAREIVSSFYMTSGVLAKTQHEYSYNVGYERQNPSSSSFVYAVPGFLAHHRYGVSDHLTVGVRGEMDAHAMSVGPTLNARMPFGELEATVAGSRAGAQSGAAAALGYAYVNTPVSVGTAVRYLSPHYATVSLSPDDARTRREADVYAAFPAGSRASLTVRHAFSDGRLSSASSITSIVSSFRISRKMNLSLTASNDWLDRQTGRQLFVGFGLMTGARTTANVSRDIGTGTNHTNVDLQQSPPAGVGYGYRVSADVDQRQAAGAFEYQGPYGRYEIARDEIDGAQTTSLRASGGIVAIGGGVYATRPVQDGFALIRVPDVAGVRAYASNQEIGRTDRHGNVLVPGLLPYYGNRLSIADDDIPLDRTVGDTEKIVAPPYRGGALLTFAVPRAQTTAGIVMLVRGAASIVPAFGELSLTLDGRSFESPIGALGEFYLENVPAGRYAAGIVYEQRTCAFSMVIPVSLAGAANIGTIRCVDLAGEQP